MPLYGAKGGASTTSDLYTIDLGTAVATSIGAIGYAVTGLAFDPTTGILYGVTSNNSAANPRSIITINTTTGAGTLVGALGLSTETATDITFSPAGQMYGESSLSNGLLLIDKATGSGAHQGAAHGTEANGGLDFKSDGVLWHVARTAGKHVSTVDTTSGVLTNVSVIGTLPGDSVAAQAFDPTDVCYLLIAGVAATHLATVDTATGVVSDIAATTFTMDGIAFPHSGGGGGGLSSPEGVCIAFTDPTLEPSPTWTRIDDGV